VSGGAVARLLRDRRGRAALLAAAAAAALLLAAAPGELAPGAARAALAVVALAAVAVLVRRAPRDLPAPSRLAVVSSRPLARDAGVALVVADGRALVVGFGAAGVRVLADLGAGQAGGTP
jgi:hypothetical protein